MKLSPRSNKFSTLHPCPTDPDYSLYEHQWGGPKYFQLCGSYSQPRHTTLVVVFDEASSHLFSTARILLYYGERPRSASPLRTFRSWNIEQSGPVIHSFRGHVQNAPPNPSTLPKVTVAFEVVFRGFTIAIDQLVCHASFDTLALHSPAGVQELGRSTMNILLDLECPLTCDTLSLSLPFTHSGLLLTPLISRGLEQCDMILDPSSQIGFVTTRIVRVLPPVSVRRRIANGSLPTELLMQIFEEVEFQDGPYDDFLSFAQVCRSWSCAMDLLHARLSFSDDGKWNSSKNLLDVYALANALSKNPLLGHGFLQFTTDNFGTLEDLKGIWSLPRDKYPALDPVRFTAALVPILRNTKNLQYLHLGHLDPCQADTLCGVLHALHDLHTFSVGGEEESQIEGAARPKRIDAGRRMLSVAQLARCMVGWPTLKVLKLHDLRHDIFSLWWSAPPPSACKLTQLTISRSRMSDKDLASLFSSSAKTLERVVLNRIEGVSNAGLSTFLLAISQNVVYLTIQDVAPFPSPRFGHIIVGRTERALDVVIDNLLALRELKISGDVASEFMLRRRSKIFVARNASEETRVPVVQLWLEAVPRLDGIIADRKWPGWCIPNSDPQH